MILTVLVQLPLFQVAAQQLGSGSDDVNISLWRVIAILVFLALLIAAAWAVIRARGGTLRFWNSHHIDRRLKITEVSRVGPQSTLCLAHYDGREYLIAFGAQGATLIDSRQIADGNPVQ